MITQLTLHFTLAEATITSQPFDNFPRTKSHYDAIVETAKKMEIVREILGSNPIRVNSWYRSPEVNRAVGGVPNSEHALGRAVDFTCWQFGTILSICQTLRAHADELNYNQLILEPTWVHISFPPAGQVGKKEVLTIRDKMTYKGLFVS